MGEPLTASNQIHLSVGAASASPFSSSSPLGVMGATSAATSGDSSSSCKNGIANCQYDMDAEAEADSRICCDEEIGDVETLNGDGPSHGDRNLPVNRAWKPSEDRKLKELVEQHGPGNWSKLATSIPGRSGKSCRLRWYNQLSPEVKQSRFSEWEDAVIIKAHAKLGNKWSHISKMLPGRTDNAVKNRWNCKLKKKLPLGQVLSNSLYTMCSMSLEQLLEQKNIRPAAAAIGPPAKLTKAQSSLDLSAHRLEILARSDQTLGHGKAQMLQGGPASGLPMTPFPFPASFTNMACAPGASTHLPHQPLQRIASAPVILVPVQFAANMAAMWLPPAFAQPPQVPHSCSIGHSPVTAPQPPAQPSFKMSETPKKPAAKKQPPKKTASKPQVPIKSEQPIRRAPEPQGKPEQVMDTVYDESDYQYLQFLQWNSAGAGAPARKSEVGAADASQQLQAPNPGNAANSLRDSVHSVEPITFDLSEYEALDGIKLEVETCVSEMDKTFTLPVTESESSTHSSEAFWLLDTPMEAQ